MDSMGLRERKEEGAGPGVEPRTGGAGLGVGPGVGPGPAANSGPTDGPTGEEDPCSPYMNTFD